MKKYFSKLILFLLIYKILKVPKDIINFGIFLHFDIRMDPLIFLCLHSACLGQGCASECMWQFSLRVLLRI